MNVGFVSGKKLYDDSDEEPDALVVDEDALWYVSLSPFICLKIIHINSIT